MAGHAGREEGGNEAGQAQVALSLVEGSERGGRPAATDSGGGRIRGGDAEPGRRCVLRDGDPSRPPLRPAPWSDRPPSSTSVLLRMTERPLQFSRHLMLHRQPPKCREGVSFLRDRCTAQRLADCRDAAKGRSWRLKIPLHEGRRRRPGWASARRAALLALGSPELGPGGRTCGLQRVAHGAASGSRRQPQGDVGESRALPRLGVPAWAPALGRPGPRGAGARSGCAQRVRRTARRHPSVPSTAGGSVIPPNKETNAKSRPSSAERGRRLSLPKRALCP